MFIELVDQLRCVRTHEDSWLVAAADRMSGRHIVDGQLGCPVCATRYPVRAAVADFRLAGVTAAGGAPAGVAPTSAAGDPVADAEEAMRLAALLSLAEVRAPVVLAGAWGGVASLLLAIAPAAYLVVNPPAPVEERPEISALLAVGTMPLAAGAAHGVALDVASAADEGLVAGAVRALRGGGRLVAPVATPLPAGLRELARDERHWVAEREAAASAPVALRRAPPG